MEACRLQRKPCSSLGARPVSGAPRRGESPLATQRRASSAAGGAPAPGGGGNPNGGRASRRERNPRVTRRQPRRRTASHTIPPGTQLWPGAAPFHPGGYLPPVSPRPRNCRTHRASPAGSPPLDHPSVSADPQAPLHARGVSSVSPTRHVFSDPRAPRAGSKARGPATGESTQYKTGCGCADKPACLAIGAGPGTPGPYRREAQPCRASRPPAPLAGPDRGHRVPSPAAPRVRKGLIARRSATAARHGIPGPARPG